MARQRDPWRERRFLAGSIGQYTFRHDLTFADEAIIWLFKAIDRLAPQVVRDLKEQVYHPLKNAEHEYVEQEASFWAWLHEDFEQKDSVEDPRPLSKILQLERTGPTIKDWSRQHHLHRWESENDEKRFINLVLSVLEQWDLAFNAPPPPEGETPQYDYPWPDPRWRPKNIHWTERERRLILGKPPQVQSIKEHDAVVRRTFEEDRVAPLLAYSNHQEFGSLKPIRMEVSVAIEPPPFFPLYDPWSSVEDFERDWEQRIEKMKALYKKRVLDKIREHGARKIDRRKLKQEHFDLLVAHQVQGHSFHGLAKQQGADRSNIRRKIRLAAEMIGLVLRPKA